MRRSGLNGLSFAANRSRWALAAGCGGFTSSIVKTLRNEPAASALPLTDRVASTIVNVIDLVQRYDLILG